MSIKRINEFPEGSGVLSLDDVFLFIDDPSSGGTTKKISLSEISSSIFDQDLNTFNSVTFNQITLPTSGNITFPNNTVQTSAGIPSSTGLVPNSASITNIVSISQANYDAIVTKNSSTLYIIFDEVS